MEHMNQQPIKCPTCGGNMICESWSTDPHSVDIHTYRLRCPAGHIWNLVEVKDETRKMVTVCTFCRGVLYDGDEWRNYLPKEVVVEKGQDAGDAYHNHQDKAVCPDCEVEHPLKFFSHAGIMWARLEEDVN